MELNMKIEDSELIITDKYGTDMIVKKYEVVDGMGNKRERLQIMPAEALNHENFDDYAIDMPIEDFDYMIDFIKNRYLIDGKEVEINEPI